MQVSDGHHVYLNAVEYAFGSNVDYAMLVKLYGQERDKEATYSPAKVISCRAVHIIGDPETEHISTSYEERSNLTMRMSMRRFARLTNAFSKQVENHITALSLYFMFYNFAVYTNHCALLLLWKQELATMFGRLKRLLNC